MTHRYCLEQWRLGESTRSLLSFYEMQSSQFGYAIGCVFAAYSNLAVISAPESQRDWWCAHVSRPHESASCSLH